MTRRAVAATLVVAAAVLMPGAAVGSLATPSATAVTPQRQGPPVLAVPVPRPARGYVLMTTGGRMLPHSTIDDASSTLAISPDGRQVAYNSGVFGVGVKSIDGGPRTAIVHRADDPAWSPDGTRLAVDGYGAGAPHYTDNIFVVTPGHPKHLFIRDSHWDTDPTWSPDGTQIAFERETPSGGIGSGEHTGIYISDGTSMHKLVDDIHGAAFSPAWSPDGGQIAFEDTRHGAHIGYEHTSDIYTIDVDGTHLRQLTHDPKRDDEAPHWSPDGTMLAYTVGRGPRSAVGVRTVGVPGSQCLLRPSWTDAWPIAWVSGAMARPTPSHCAASLRQPRPKPRFGCSKAAANSAVGRSHVPWSYQQFAHPGPWGIHLRCLDFTNDGKRDLAVLFDGGGSGAVIGWAAFRRTNHDWKQVLFRRGDRLDVAVSGDRLVVTNPVYRAGDCHCEPTGGVEHREYGWRGHRLVVVARWHTNS